MNESISLDVALDVIGTLRMMKMQELNRETDPQKKEQLHSEFKMLTTEERIAQGLERFEGWKEMRISIMDKIDRLYAPQLKAYYAAH